MKETITQTFSATFAVLAVAFLEECILHIETWLIVIAMCVLVDFILGVRRAIMLGEDLRFSTALRRTFNKVITYFSIAVLSSAVCVQTGEKYYIDYFICGLIVLAEACSMVGNILRAKSYAISMATLLIALRKAAALLLAKQTGTDKRDIEEIITTATNAIKGSNHEQK